MAYTNSQIAKMYNDIQTIKKYLDIDEGGIEIELNREDRSVALVASIPLKNMERRTRGK